MLSITFSAPKRNICAGNGSAASSLKCSDTVMTFSSTVRRWTTMRVCLP